ncbi:MAG: hypothetical protein ABUK11_01040 [Mariprofundaceae bacterium]
MNQSELEKFVDELALAEQKAARKIDDALKAWEERLASRNLELEQGMLEQLEALKKEFLNDEKKLKENMLRYHEDVKQQTDSRIEELQKIHDLKIKQLLRWLVKQVTEP